MARAVSRKMSRATPRKMSRATPRKISKRRNQRMSKRAACVSKAAKKMFKKSTPRTSKGRGRVLARAQKACSKK